MDYRQLLSQAIAQGYLSQQQARESFYLWQKAREKRPGVSLEIVLVKGHYLSIEQLQQLQKMPGVSTPASPNIADAPAAVAQMAPTLTRKKAPPLPGCQPGQHRENQSREIPVAVTATQKSQDGPLAPMTTVGPFSIISLLGVGGMGAVYLAEQKSLKRQVALKVMTKMISQNKAYIDRFLREVELNARLDHPHIIKTYMTGLHGELPYMAMAYVKGKSLGQYLSENQVSNEQKLQIIHDIAQALHHAHSTNIIHRDVKPSNIMITDNGQAMLMDFGIAKSNRVEDHRLTRTGQAIGTPRYMAPEQVRGRKDLDARCDVYSLGAVLYEIITGCQLFPGPNDLQLMYRVVSEYPQLPRQIDSSIPEDLEAIIVTAIEKKRDERYQSCREMAQDISLYLKRRQVGAFNKYRRKKIRWRLAMYRKLLCTVLLCSFIFVGAALVYCFYPDSVVVQPPKTAFDRLEELSRRLHRQPSIQIYHRYLDLLVKNGQIITAIEHSSEAITWARQHSPQQLPQLYRRKAHLLLQSERYYESYELYQQLHLDRDKKGIPLDASSLLQWARAAFALQRYQQTLDILREISVTSLAAEQRQQYIFYKAAGQLQNFRNNLAQTGYLKKLSSGDFADNPIFSTAINALTQVVQAREKQASWIRAHAYAYLAYAWLCRGQRRQIQKCLQKCPATVEALLTQEIVGTLCYIDKKYHQAARHFSRCIDIAPWTDYYYDFRAQCYLHDSSPPVEKILDDCLTVMNLSPHNLSPLATIIESLFCAGLLDRCFFIISMVIEILERGDIDFAPQLWEQECKIMAAKYLRKPTPGKSKKLIGPEQIQFLIEKLQTASTVAAQRVAAQMLTNFWYHPQVAVALQQAQKIATTKAKTAIAEALQVIATHRQQQRRTILRDWLTRFFVARDLSVCRKIDTGYCYLLQNILEDATEPALLRYWAARMLLHLQLPTSQRILAKGSHSQNLVTRAFCLAVPGYAGFSVAYDLTPFDYTALCKMPPIASAIFLHHQGHHLARPILRKLLQQHPDQRVKVASAKALLSLGDADAIDFLQRQINQSQREIRDYACWWLCDPGVISNPQLEKKLASEKNFWRYLDLLDSESKMASRIVIVAAVAKLTDSGHLPHSRQFLSKFIARIEKLIKHERHESVRRLFYAIIASLGKPMTVLAYINKIGETLPNRIATFYQLVKNMRSRPGKKGYRGFTAEFVKMVQKLRVVNDDDPDFSPIGLLLLVKTAKFYENNPLINLTAGMITANMKAAILSRHENTRMAAAYAYLIDTRHIARTRKLMQERLVREKSPAVRQILIAGLIHFSCQLGLTDTDQIVRRFIGSPKEYSQAMAYAYYQFIERVFDKQPPLFPTPLITQWGRDQRYLSHWQALARTIAYEEKRPSRSKIMKWSQKPDAALAADANLHQLAKLQRQARQVVAGNNKNFSPEQLALFSRLFYCRELATLLNYLNKSRKYAPGNARYHFEAAFLLECLGEWRQAMICLRQARNLEPERQLYQLLEARLNFRLGNIDRAATQVEQLVARKINGYELMELQGKICLQQQKTDAALEAFIHQHLINPYVPTPLLLRAQVLIWQKKYREANEKIGLAYQTIRDERQFIKKRSLDRKGRFWTEIELNQAEGHGNLALARLAALQGDYRTAFKYLQQSYNNFLFGCVLYQESPLSLQNLRKYPELRPLLATLSAKLPEKIIGPCGY